MTLSTVPIAHSPHRTNSTRSARLMYTQAALSSSNNAAEFSSFVLESSHDSKMRYVLLTALSESREMSWTVERLISNDTPSSNCSVEVKLCRAKSSRKLLSNISRKIKTTIVMRKSIVRNINLKDSLKCRKYRLEYDLDADRTDLRIH